MTLRDIAEHLQRDLPDSPRQKIKKLRKGTDLRFVRTFLGDWLRLAGQENPESCRTSKNLRSVYAVGDEVTALNSHIQELLSRLLRFPPSLSGLFGKTGCKKLKVHTDVTNEDAN
jgi:hypothetical protein